MTTSVTMSPPQQTSSEQDYLSICEFLSEETVQTRSGQVLYTVPPGMDGKTLSEVTIKSLTGESTAGNSCTFTVTQAPVDAANSHDSGNLVYNSASFTFQLNIPLVAGSLIRLNVVSVTGTFMGLSATFTIA